MKRTILGVVAVSAVAGAVVIPSIAIGNARRTEGSLAAIQAAETPYIAELEGSNEVPRTGRRRRRRRGHRVVRPLDAVDDRGLLGHVVQRHRRRDARSHPHAARPACAAARSSSTSARPGAGTSHTGCGAHRHAVADPILAEPGGLLRERAQRRVPRRRRPRAARGGPGSRRCAPTSCRPRCVRTTHASRRRRSSPPPRPVPSASARGRTSPNAESIAVPPGATAAIVTITATETGRARLPHGLQRRPAPNRRRAT